MEWGTESAQSDAVAFWFSSWGRCMPGLPMLCGLFARHAEESRRAGVGNTRIRKSTIYTSSIRSELERCWPNVSIHLGADPEPEGLNAAASPETWREALGSCQRHCIGVALVEAMYSPDLVSVLTSHQRSVVDFWRLTQYGQSPLMLVSFVECAMLAAPVVVYEHLSRSGVQALFFETTVSSWQRLMDERVASGALVADLFREWGARLPGGEGRQRICMVLPTPHAVLCVGGQWRSWAFPIPASRRPRASLQLHLAAPLWQHLALNVCNGADAVAVPDVTAERLLVLADVLRQHLRAHRSGDGVSAQLNVQTVGQLHFVQGLRDALILDTVQRSRKAFALDALIEAMLFSGCLQSTRLMRVALEHALHVTVRTPQLLTHFLDVINQPHAIPSSTTLYRHRLTLHLAYCAWVAEVQEDMLSDDGCVRYTTLDASPQGGYDWLLFGSTTIRTRELPRAFRMANELCDPGLTEEREREIVHFLAPLLQIRQAPPVALGSGRASLKHKTHAVLHGERLCSKSWQSAIQAVHSTLTWTGDLGTESGIIDVHCRFRSLFPWALRQVAPAGGELPEARFDFEEEGADQDGPEDPDQFDFQVPRAHVGAAEVAEGGAGDVDNLRATVVDLTRGLYLPGVLHTIHNCTKDLGTGLGFWDEWLEGLMHVCRLMTNKWSKTRILQTCFRDLPARAFATQVREFNCLVFSGRWGSILVAVQELLPLHNVLRAAWSRHTYGHVGNRDEDGGWGGAAKVDIVDKAIHSPKWWAYTQMVAHISSALLKAAGWAEGCACHQEEFDALGRRRWRDVFRRRADEDSCPMKSRRAPECARNALLRLMRDFFEVDRGLEIKNRSMNHKIDEQQTVTIR